MEVHNTLLAAGIIGILVMTAMPAYAKEMSAQDFVHKASVANEFEIESSNMALHKSHNSEVKSFAQRMVDDHTQTGEQLKDALESSQSHAEPMETLDDKHQDMLNELDDASGKDFDRLYISMQTDAHKEAVGLFSDYYKHGKDGALRKFAAQTLPTLRDHLKHVTQLKANY